MIRGFAISAAISIGTNVIHNGQVAGWDLWARDLEWTPSYVTERELYPEPVSGTPWLPGEAWRGWDEPFKINFPEYVRIQSEKERAVEAIRQALGGARSLSHLDPGWLSAVKLHAATLPLAEFAAVVGNLRGARFGRTSEWRTAAMFGALDELRHTQIPLLLMSELVRLDAQFDWTHRLFHSNNWVSIAARHAFDEMLLAGDALEFAIATNFVFETGFTNLQFIGLSSLSDKVGDHMFRSMLDSIQTDEARHAQIGLPTLAKIVEHDRARAQYLVDKWFWRSWLLFAVVTGTAMDYLTPLAGRGASFREFVQEWVKDQFAASLREVGLSRPWYWDIFERSAANYHHMIYASAYSYRSTVWFDLVLPGPDERRWLHSKYPDSWPSFEPVWDRLTALWRRTPPGVDMCVHGTAIPTFCALCQIILAHGTPEHNDACSLRYHDKSFVFCSEPCKWIFEREPERYAGTLDIVKQVLEGRAPGNLIAFLTEYCGLTYETWGKDAAAGEYDWLEREPG